MIIVVFFLLSGPTTYYGGTDIAITLSRCVCVWVGGVGGGWYACGYVGVHVSVIKRKPLIAMI